MVAGDGEEAGMAVIYDGPSYNTVSKWFHWVTVGLMAVALPVGVVIQFIKL